MPACRRLAAAGKRRVTEPFPWESRSPVKTGKQSDEWTERRRRPPPWEAVSGPGTKLFFAEPAAAVLRRPNGLSCWSRADRDGARHSLFSSNTLS